MSPKFKFRTHTSLKTGRVRRQITPSPLAFLPHRRLIIGLLLLFLIILFVYAWSQEAGYIVLAGVTHPYWGKDYDDAKEQRGKDIDFALILLAVIVLCGGPCAVYEAFLSNPHYPINP